MRRLRSHRRLLTVATAGIIAVGLGACSSTSSPSSAKGGSSTATSKTLVMESSPESTITQDFNPFVNTGQAYGMGATGLIYEPLIQFNLAAPPKYYPWLATAHAWSHGGETHNLHIRPRGEWYDGT